jgi:AcrR family transcriptional regulator
MPDHRVRRRNAYHHGDLRRALLDATLQLITERGATGFTLREVARRAGVSHNAPYRHFRSSDALLAGVAAEGFTALSAALVRATAGATTPLDAFVRSGVAYVEFALAHPGRYRVMFGSRLKKTGHPTLEWAAEQAFNGLVTLIKRGQETHVFAEGDAHARAQVAWSLVHGLADLAIAGQLAIRGRRLRELTAFARTVLAKGLRG